MVDDPDEVGAISSPNPQKDRQAADVSDEIEFIAPPPKDLECPLCLQIIKQPTLTDCGHHFCRACIDRVIANDHTCPLCKEKGFQTMLDRATERKILALRVRCRMKFRGCQWEGEFADLERHLDAKKGDCGFVEAECEFSSTGCTTKILRKNIPQHMEESTHKHLILLAMPQGGNESERRLQEKRAELLQQLLRREEKTIKELEKLKYELQAKDREIKEFAGQPQEKSDQMKQELTKLKEECDKKVEELRAKDEELAKMKEDHDKQTQELQEQKNREITEVKGELQEREQNIKQLEQRVQSLEFATKHTLPCEFVMTNFNWHKEYTTEWFGPPFYSHPGGYKQCLAVYANGHDAGHRDKVTYCFYTMHGEYDDHLKWPRQLDVSFDVMNHKTGKWKFAEGCTTIQQRQKPKVERERIVCYHIVFTHSDLEQYLKNDSLYFRINKVTPK